MLEHVSEFHSFLGLNDNSLHAYATFCLSILLLMDSWVASPLGYVNNTCVHTGVQIPV